MPAILVEKLTNLVSILDEDLFDTSENRVLTSGLSWLCLLQLLGQQSHQQEPNLAK
jgi:hypothetical protein